jgi:hypothetical protein
MTLGRGIMGIFRKKIDIFQRFWGVLGGFRGPEFKAW